MIAIAFVLMVGCGGDDAAAAVDAGDDGDAAAADAGTVDGGGDAGRPAADAGRDAGEVDVDAGSSAPDASMCSIACALAPVARPFPCPDDQACRIHDCSTYCGALFPGAAQAHYGDACTNLAQCERGLQCLARASSGSGSCYGFCRLDHPEDCAIVGGRENCAAFDDVRTIDDDVPVVFPPGFGVCW